MPQFRLIDGNAIGWRLHCAAALEYNERLSVEMQGVRAFAGQLSNLASDADCLNLLLWDGRAQWRYDLHPAYKSGRHATEQQREQRRRYEAARPYMQAWARLAPVIQLTHAQMEADDLAFRLCDVIADAGYSVELLTVDSDWAQLVRRRVSWRSIGKGSKRLIEESFEGESPVAAIAHVKALAGDRSDTIDGLKNVGDTRALQLLRAHGGLDALLRAAASLEGLQSPEKWAQQLNLQSNRDIVERNRQLVELSRAPRFDLAQTKVEVGQYDFLDALNLCNEHGFADWEQDFPAAVRGITKSFDEGRLRTLQRLAGLPG